MTDKRMNKSRTGRAVKLGGVAAGHAARSAGTRVKTVGKGKDARQQAIGRQQLETADRLFTVLGSMKGAAMKIGQTLSVIDPGVVPEEFREEFQAKLARLQSMAPSVAFKDMKKVIEQDLEEKLSDVFAEFDEGAIAAASIGQVYRARLEDGREVAVKVQYPGIKEIVRADLQNLDLGLKLIGRLVPGLDTKEVAAEIRERITEELDYELESANHRALAREYRGHPFIFVPEVVTSLSRERVIVSEFVDGRRFAEVTGDSDEDRSRWGEILFRFYVNGPYRHRLLNGDPHPGNSLFMPDGRVGFIDFGFFKRQTREEVEVQLEVLRAVYAQNADELFSITKREGIIKGDAKPELVDALMDKYRAVSGWFMEDEDVTIDSAITARLLVEHADMRKEFGSIRLPANQVVTLRAFGLLLGILGQLNATNNWFRIGREVIFGDPAETELGRIEASHLGLAPA